MIDMSDFIYKATRGGTRKERFYACTHKCGHTTHLRLNDARKAADRVCGNCQRKAAYKQAVKKAGGKRGFMEAIAKWQATKISGAEQWVIDLLAANGWIDGLNYSRQQVLKISRRRYYIADFVFEINGRMKVIEPAGYWHKKNNKRRDAHLVKVLEILIIDADLIKTDPEQIKAAILRFLSN